MSLLCSGAFAGILGTMHPLPGLMERRTKLVGIVLPSFSPTAVDVLEKALRLGLEDRQDAQAGRSMRWSGRVQLWLDSGRFSCTLGDSPPFSLAAAPDRQRFLPSSLITSSTLPEVIGHVESGHLTVAVCESLSGYLEGGGEPSVHALAETLLAEAVRVTRLGLPAGDRLQRLLDTFCSLSSDCGAEMRH